MAQGVAGSNPVTHPNYPISLQRNDIGHISDGEYLSEMFYVALSLGLGAIVSSYSCV